jgi:hypothetical protein
LPDDLSDGVVVRTGWENTREARSTEATETSACRTCASPDSAHGPDFFFCFSQKYGSNFGKRVALLVPGSTENGKILKKFEMNCSAPVPGRELFLKNQKSTWIFLSFAKASRRNGKILKKLGMS